MCRLVASFKKICYSFAGDTLNIATMNKKLFNLLMAAIVFVAMAVAFFVGCKKDNNEVVANTDRREAQALLNKIKTFQALCEAVDFGVKTDGVMTVEAMRESLDLVSNYEHSQHMIFCKNTVLDTLHVTMPAIDGNGNVREADVVATYRAFETALEQRMCNVKDGLELPSYFSIMLPEIISKEDSDIDIVFLRGEEGNIHSSVGPFMEGDDWYWGGGYGKCNGDTCCFGSDAADQLSQKFVFDNTPPEEGMILVLYDVEFVEYIAHPTNYTNYNPYVYYEDQNPEGCSEYWIFAMEMFNGMDVPCIERDEMNCYWRNIRRLLVLPTGPLHYSPYYHSPYNQCELIPRDLYPKIEEQYNTVYVHTARVRYCGVSWIINEGGGHPIPGAR